MVVALSILPIFLVMALGFAGARRGFLPPAFVEPANRLAYWLAIPALILRAVATAPLHEAFQPRAAAAAVAAMLICWLLAWALGARLFSPSSGPNPSRASWVQGSLHGNQAYLGLAVVFYALGQAGLNTVALVAAVIIIVQNFMAAVSLTRLGGGAAKGGAFSAVAMNPIILSSAIGLLFPLFGVSLPAVVERTLHILGGMGLPLALLIIGAKLSEGKLGGNWLQHSALAAIKLFIQPAMGLILLRLMGVDDLPTAVTVLLLASPTATISVILADQMGGDARLSSEAVTISHAAAALSYTLWLWWLLG
jgi:hypothetical protein